MTIPKTIICNLLKIEYPIIQGGMLWLATAELAAAVSNSGGLGVISPLAGMEKNGDPIANMAYQLQKVSELTSKPFGVNIPLDLPYADKLVDLVINHKVGIVITAAGSPYRYSTQLKERGITVLHVVSSVKHAVKAEMCGVDGVVAEGIEAAAHNGAEELPLFSLIPQVVDAISIPVIAAGGIVDDRGLVATMALGAEGVQLGTRFVAVEECIAHLAYKRAIIDAKDTDTFITCRSIVPTRSLKTDFTLGLFALEKSGADPEVLREYIGYRTNRDAQIEGDLNHGEAYCGASAGLIKEILSVKELIQQLVDGYSKVIKKLR